MQSPRAETASLKNGATVRKAATLGCVPPGLMSVPAKLEVYAKAGPSLGSRKHNREILPRFHILVSAQRNRR